MWPSLSSEGWVRTSDIRAYDDADMSAWSDD